MPSTDSTNNILTPKQWNRAWQWYLNHTAHVSRIRKMESDKNFAPSLIGDKNDPRLWKPGHWNWFFSTFKLKSY